MVIFRHSASRQLNGVGQQILVNGFLLGIGLAWIKSIYRQRGLKKYSVVAKDIQSVYLAIINDTGFVILW